MKEEMIPVLGRLVRWAEAEAEKALPEDREWFQAEVYTPEADRQDRYGPHVCGSSYCLAGKLVADHFGVEDPYDTRTDRAPMGVMDYAAELLGLTEMEADVLFWEDNSIHDIRHLAESIAGREL